MGVSLWLRRFAWATLVANIALVVTGGAVRLTGSGLGCPTWPRCTDSSFTPHGTIGMYHVTHHQLGQFSFDVLMAEACENLAAGLRVDAALVANLKFSDEDMVDAVKARIHALDKAFSARLRIRLVGNAAEDVKQQLLSDADLFVLPTRHEGFCVPILEALASGCQVVAYDNSNTPAVSGGLARLVPTGDTAALADAMAAAMASVTGGAWRAGEEYRAAAAAAEHHLRNFSIPVVRKRFLDFIQRQDGGRSRN